MKFAFIIILSLITIVISERNEKETDMSNNQVMNKVKTKSRITAVSEDESKFQTKTFSEFSKLYFRKLFSLTSPINKCHEDNCEFCCLSLNVCGSKEQCINSNYTMNILKVMFLGLVTVLFISLVFKIAMTDSNPEHQDEDKVDDNTLNMLIGLFIQNRENRRKFKL